MPWKLLLALGALILYAYVCSGGHTISIVGTHAECGIVLYPIIAAKLVGNDSLEDIAFFLATWPLLMLCFVVMRCVSWLVDLIDGQD